MESIISKTFIVVIIIAVSYKNAYAYIDPGILSMFIQTVFVVIGGIVAAWAIRPWSALKSFFRKITGRKDSVKTQAPPETIPSQNDPENE